ncbi:hypothetical protein AAC387_Pa01g3570 [Persea americana]
MSPVSSTCQIHPTAFIDSFQASLSRFSGYRLQFLRYNHSNPHKKHHFSSNLRTISSAPFPERNPQKNSNLVAENRKNGPLETPISQTPSNGSFQNGNWMDKWSGTQFQNLPKRPKAVLDYRNGGVSSEDDEGSGSTSTSASTMDRIVEKLKRFGYVDDMIERNERVPERGSVEDIFYVEEGMLPNSRGGFPAESPLGVENSDNGGDGRSLFPWEKRPLNGEAVRNAVRMRRSKTSVAELTLPELELRRLRHLALAMKSRMKIGGAGVTKVVVDAIHEKWKLSEVVRLKCEGPPTLNMKRLHEILERKTGGLVIWRSGTSVSLYRGVGYELPSAQSAKKRSQLVPKKNPDSFSIATEKATGDSIEKSSHGYMQATHARLEDAAEEKKEPNSMPEIKYETEIDKLLDGLGPRYTDWPGSGPLPVDADLLPGVVPGYKSPFRILPYGVRPTIGGKEMTSLRRLARVLPPHFALGRSRQHQGLAMAMAKLWERSSIAIIALKRGVQLTTSERMAEDIKKLTGGTLITRNKDFIVFYRGKNFLSPDVTEALLERERLAKDLQDEEERARLRASSSLISDFERIEQPGTAGTLEETLEADARWGKRLDDEYRNKMMRAAEAARHADLVRKLDLKLHLAERKLMKAERVLAKVEAFLQPAEQSSDPESITDEERFMFRKLGLRMKAFLLLGRRGVFDGTVENMHLHWKYRELVKVIINARNFSQVKNVALALEAESGGVLVSVDKVSKGFAIIVYRGKDYQRPRTLRPKNLLTKRKALARSIELQRHEALCKHISNLQQKVTNLKSELDQMESVKDEGDEELYEKLESAYPSADEETEDEGDEAYLETYHSGADYYSGADNEDHYETNFPYDHQNPVQGSDDDTSKFCAIGPTGPYSQRSEGVEINETNL